MNPKGESRRWETYTVTDRMSCEFMLLKDVDADGKLEFLFKDSENKFVYAKPDPANPTGLWTKHAISEPGPWANHGMGVGDVNGDGRVDFLNAFGWWEQPIAESRVAASQSRKSKVQSRSGTWTYHPAAFGKWTRSSPGGAEMAVYDVNGDGLNDVVTSLQAHGLGLSWFEQKKAADGSRSFVEHPIMTDFSTKNAGGVMFSQLHGATYADVDGDGLQDFITGKRFWSHLDTFIDPDPHGAAGAVRLSHRAEPEGAWRRRVRARADPQPFRRRLAPVCRRSQQGRQRRNHHVDQAGHVHLLEQLEGASDNMRLLRATAVVIAAATVVGAQAPKPERDWPAHGHDAGAQRYSPLKQINTTNVSNLQLVWTYDTPAAVPPAPRAAAVRSGRGRAERGSPPARGESGHRRRRRVRRRDNRRRRRSWSTASCTWGRCTTASSRWMRIPARKSGSRTSATHRRRGASRTGRATNGIPPQLVFGTGDGSSLLISLNAKTGEFTPGFGQGGKVDLRQGVGEKFPKLRVALSSPPAIYKHLAITGNHSQEAPSLGPSGDVRAWDLRTGKLVWTFHTIPRPGEPNHDAWKNDQWVDRAGRQRVGIHHRR